MSPSPTTVKRCLVAMAAFALLAASCGQYRNVHSTAVAAGEAGNGLTTSEGGTSSGLTGGSSTGGGLSGGTTTTGGLSGGTSSGGAISGSPGGGSSSSSSGGGSSQAEAPPSGGGDQTGVTDNTITIGIHAPLTGAAPVREASFDAGKDLYWKYGNDGKPVEIYGRTVKVEFQDDHYNPSYARQVCSQMAEQDHAFLLIGGAGTDQIKACAEYAQGRGIPYLSAGVTETELNHFSTYFATSMTYPDQSVLLADYIKHNFTNQASQVVMIAEDTPNFDDAVAAFEQAFPGVKVYRPSKNDDGSTMAANICAGPEPVYKIVFPLVAPVYYLEMAKAASCHPQYLGIGLTEGIDQVASTGCAANNSTEGAQFFNPSPAWQDRARFDPTYEKAIAAAKKDNGGSFTDDDIVWLLWGLMKDVGVLLKEAGPNLNRQGFIFSTQKASVQTGIYPSLKFSPNNHFGASQVHVLQNVCKSRGQNEAGYYVTKFAFKSSF